MVIVVTRRDRDKIVGTSWLSVEITVIEGYMET